jgi:acyl carrier protein
MIQIWKDVMGLDALSPHDNFFELGGHSLLAAQLIARLRAEIGASIPIRWLFESPTPAELAARIEEAAGSS